MCCDVSCISYLLQTISDALPQILLGGIGSFLGLLAIASLNAKFYGKINLPLLLGCFGASATLLFGMMPISLCIHSDSILTLCTSASDM